METKNEEWSDGKLALFHKEAVVQFILRSPLLLSSSVPPDYAEQLRRPYTPEELEEAMPQDSMPRLLHRLSSISNSSELSFRNSTKDSDSEGPNESSRVEVGASEVTVGSTLLCSNPGTSFEEMMEKMRSIREKKEEKSIIGMNEVGRTKDRQFPGSNNSIVTLLI